MNLQNKLGNLSSKLTKITGTSKEETYDEEELRNKVRSALDNDEKAENMTEMDKQIALDHVMQEIEAIESQAKEVGRQEERMKGENSDDLYNMVTINLLMTGALLLLYVWQNFM